MKKYLILVSIFFSMLFASNLFAASDTALCPSASEIKSAIYVRTLFLGPMTVVQYALSNKQAVLIVINQPQDPIPTLSEVTAPNTATAIPFELDGTTNYACTYAPYSDNPMENNVMWLSTQTPNAQENPQKLLQAVLHS